MAKKKRNVNKSQAIRDYLKRRPRAKPKTVVEALEGQGISVTPQSVSTVKFQQKQRRKKRVVGRKKKRATRSAGTRGDRVFEALVEAKRLVDRLGGIEKAKQALTMLEKLK